MAVACILLLTTVNVVVANDVGDFTYTVLDGKTTITGYTGAGGDVVLPSTLGGCPVVAIGDSAFIHRTSITSVTLSNGITSIGYNAFRSCNSLTSVTISDSVISIASSAFDSCPSLAWLALGANVTEIGDFAFWGCTALASLNLPASVSMVGDMAFTGCNSLTMINVDVGNVNFASLDGVLYNKSFTKIIQYPGGKAGAFTTPESVATVGYYSFGESISLTSVMVSSNVTSIEGMAFTTCPSLTEIVVDAGNANYASLNGVLYNKNLTSMIQFPGGRADSYAIPDGVTSIGMAFFSSKLTSVTMPHGIASIQAFAFEMCASLTSITIGHDVASIGAFAFWGCPSLSSVTVPDGLSSIGAYAFAQSAITSFTIGKNVTSIGQGPFYQCSKMTQIIVAQDNAKYASLEGVLYNKTFATLIQYPCGKAGPFVVPEGVSTIEDDAFAACSLLTSVAVSDNVTSIGGESFMNCDSLNSVVVGRGVTSIGDSSFSGCANLTSISFLGPLSPTHVGSDWLAKTSADLRGHAYNASDFPKPGGNFHGLVMGTIIPAAPGAPINLTASMVGAKAVLAWIAPDSGPVTNYNVYRSGSVNDTFLLIATSSGTNYTDAGVASGQTYWYKVSASNGVGEGPKSAAASILVPSTSNNDALIIVALIAIMVLLLLALIAMWNSSKGQR
jgi:hypothetical protein